MTGTSSETPGVTRWRKRPVTVEAVRWTGDNALQLAAFTGSRFGIIDPEDRTDAPELTGQVFDVLHCTWVGMSTGQWVIKGVRGEFYPCDDAVLAETYDPADGDGGAIAAVGAEVPAEAVTAAARVLAHFVSGTEREPFPEPDAEDITWAVESLKAAAPYICAEERERIAAEIDLLAEEFARPDSQAGTLRYIAERATFPAIREAIHGAAELARKAGEQS